MVQTFASTPLQIQAEIARELENTKKDEARGGRKVRTKWRRQRRRITNPEAYAAAIQRRKDAGVTKEEFYRERNVLRTLRRNHTRGNNETACPKKPVTLPKLKFMEDE